jgi:hypothetical protein
MSDIVSRLIAFEPSDGARRVAARACISIAVPLAVLVAWGHTSWTLYASFGAFTSLYGRERVDRSRLLLQTEAGCVQTLCVTLGAVVGISAHRAWLAVPIAAVVAVLAAARSAHAGWHPPGSLFQVFAFAAVASIPGTWPHVGIAAAVAGSAAAFSILVGAAGTLQRRARGYGLVSMNRPIGGAVEEIWRHALQAGVGVLLAGAIATASGIGRPYWAMVAAVVPLAARTMSAQVVRGLHRVVGTLLGLLVAWPLLELDPTGLLVVVMVSALQAAAELLVGRNYAVALIFVTPLAMLMVHLAVPVPGGPRRAAPAGGTLIGAPRPRLRLDF